MDFTLTLCSNKYCILNVIENWDTPEDLMRAVICWDSLCGAMLNRTLAIFWRRMACPSLQAYIGFILGLLLVYLSCMLLSKVSSKHIHSNAFCFAIVSRTNCIFLTDTAWNLLFVIYIEVVALNKSIANFHMLSSSFIMIIQFPPTSWKNWHIIKLLFSVMYRTL